jgi:hypothetical protein
MEMGLIDAAMAGIVSESTRQFAGAGHEPGAVSSSMLRRQITTRIREEFRILTGKVS